ncbi:YicC/YloC family endoribonuclease [Ramlibacter alkalitolerans]|uniref:YicC family protein n=1 Tax=Ramlibacter alkalitolerans TaxID=2039631 RepID=A0ABS1JR25_9BURK|nr:YicC/YloC family endoribonuclease [Ramlibacter alkalitolerans]MBL0426606.1 YicC family protein [Ramlibacter alkalitolerans]
MPVYSMTGYASAQHSPAATPAGEGNRPPAGMRLGLEIRSVNSRFLDLSFRLSEELRAHEPALRELITGRIKRGKVEVRAGLEGSGAEVVREPTVRMLQRLGSVQDTVRGWLPDAPALSVAEILRLASTEDGGSVDWSEPLQQLARQVLGDLLAAREREGARLATMLQGHLQQLRSLAEQARPLVPQLVEQQRQRFLERWKEAMALSEGAATPEAAQDRALTEATAFAIRIDVAEELTRLAAHLEEIERLVNKGGEIGKRLDFLIQELHREANTLGSKSAAMELTRISVDMKVLIEQMREQVQNLE